jgi:hypothetical protein
MIYVRHHSSGEIRYSAQIVGDYDLLNSVLL